MRQTNDLKMVQPSTRQPAPCPSRNYQSSPHISSIKALSASGEVVGAAPKPAFAACSWTLRTRSANPSSGCGRALSDGRIRSFSIDARYHDRSRSGTLDARQARDSLLAAWSGDVEKGGEPPDGDAAWQRRSVTEKADLQLLLYRLRRPQTRVG